MSDSRHTAPAGIQINTEAIPSCAQYNLASAAVALIRNIMSQPEGREALAARMAAKK